MINTNKLSNFVNIKYNYKTDDSSEHIKSVIIDSNSVLINLVNRDLDIIPSSASIQYRYVVNPNDISKIAITNTEIAETLFSYASLKTSKKTSDMNFADINDTINYIITVTNNGNLPANNVIFKDPMPKGVRFIPGSIVIDGEPLYDININPNIGFNIGMIPSKTFKVVTFKVKVVNIPLNNEINNIAQFSYDFSLNESDPSAKIYGEDITEKGALTKVCHADLSKIRKEVDKSFIYFGDILTYTTTIPNIGNVDAINVLFHEYVPSKTKLIEESIKVIVDGIITHNKLGKEDDSIINLKIDNIPFGKEAIVVFKVKVID